MIQIIFMVIGVVYLFKLVSMTKNTGSDLSFDAEKLANWQSHRRQQYIWMIAAGWGSAAVSFGLGILAVAVLNASGQLTQENASAAQIVVLVISLIVMFSCYRVSSSQAKKAKELERGDRI